ncbi:MAG: type II secretion system protein GspD [Hirschia sp.]|nr:type II secretion system protein GspD [Hirschia sp.]MBF20091.1 type II secretion system protein GspD [Hirschia sp.]
MTAKFSRTMAYGAMAAVAGGFLAPGLMSARADDLGDAAIRDRKTQGQHVVNLKDVDISVLIDDVSAMTGYTFVVHPSVRGQVTVSSQSALTMSEVFQIFLATLRVHGFTAIPAQDGVYRIVPEQSASQSAALANPGVGGDQFETLVLNLDNFDAVEAAKMIKPITNPQGQVSASAKSNSLIVVDYAANISRIRQVIAEIDQDRSTLTSIQLENMSASEMANIVTKLTGPNNRGVALDVDTIAVESNNSVVIRGDAADVARTAQIVREMDKRGGGNQETLKVIALANSEAADIAPILENLGKSMAETAAPAGGAKTLPNIQVYEPTNSVIISADPLILRQLERVVEELDVRRSQVLVEAVIVELSDSAARELGVQFVLSGQENSNVPFASTNFTDSTPSILTLAGALVGDSLPGDNSTDVSGLQSLAVSSLLASNGALFGIGGQLDNGGIFGAIINAVDDDTASNILSTPSVLTLDNETASIIVGQEIPITTGEVVSATNDNPFRTVERKDVGVELEVTPQIGDGDSIKLQLRQGVSSIFGGLTVNSEIITNKREITNTILADNGDIIILGGLIQEDESISVSKVPLLGDIPGLGRLFRSEGKSTQRTNLMVFLRPTIVRDRDTAQGLTNRKLDYVRQQQRLATGRDEADLDIFMRDVLGVDPAN